MLKKFLIVGAVLGSTLFVAGAGAMLGVMLGTRALVGSADAMRTTAPLSMAIATPGDAGDPEVRLAMRSAIAAGE